MHSKRFSAASLVITSVLVAALPARAEDTEPVSKEPVSENVTLSPFEVIQPDDPRYLADMFGRFGLKPLAGETMASAEECFRFLWLRAFHRAALFEVRFKADGTGVFESKLWEEGRRPELGRWVTQRTVALDAKARAAHRETLDHLGFFALPFYDGRIGYDGAGWFFEVRDGERSHAVYCWSPEPGPLRELGVSLIEAAISSEFLPIY